MQSATGKAPPFDRTIDSLLFTLSNGDITAAINAQNDYFKKTENLVRGGQNAQRTTNQMY
ncbi:hypothetical protein QUB37_05820 [Microcoleus sp. AT3-A2]|uniref:hypothetical protein n=1 Tax=Microcoleus sp. AT3-A2 TaxID=2818610 RepID=UPI002FD62E87